MTLVTGFVSHDFSLWMFAVKSLFQGGNPLGCGEGERLRTVTLELPTFQQVPLFRLLSKIELNNL